MAQTALLTIRIEEDLKKKVAKKAKELGMSLSQMTKLFYRSLINKKDVNIYFGDEEFDNILKKTLNSREGKELIKRISKAI